MNKKYAEFGFMTFIVLVFFLLTGCGQETAMETTSPAFTATAPPEPAEDMIAKENLTEDKPRESAQPVTGTGSGTSLIADLGEDTQVSYDLINWKLCDTWADTGIAESDIPLTTGPSNEFMVFSKEVPQPRPDGGILMLELEIGKHSDSGAEGRLDCFAMIFQEESGASSELTGNTLGLGICYSSLGTMRPDTVLADYWEEYWAYTLPPEGERITVTIAAIVSPEARLAIEQGSGALTLDPFAWGTAQPAGDTEYIRLIPQKS